MKLSCYNFFSSKFYGDFTYLNLNQFYLDNKDKIKNTKIPSQIQLELYNLRKNTYGGYGENRKDIWKGTYLDKDKKYIHLGIDINVPAGTRIECPFNCVIYDRFKDIDTKIGWGGRLILQREINQPYLILAHLNPQFLLFPSNYIRKGQILGEVGTWPTNGNTFQHLHVQAVYDLDIKNFDGYGSLEDLKNNPNPFEIEF